MVVLFRRNILSENLDLILVTNLTSKIIRFITDLLYNIPQLYKILSMELLRFQIFLLVLRYKV